MSICSCLHEAVQEGVAYYGGDGDALASAVADEIAAPGGGEGGARGGRRQFDDGESHDTRLAPSKSLNSDVKAALVNLTTSASECSENSKVSPGEPCSSRKVVEAIKKFHALVDTKNAPPPAKGGTLPPPAKGSKAPPAKGSKVPPPAGTATLPTNSTAAAQAVRKVARVLGCTSESCVVAHPEFKKFAVTAGPIRDSRELDAELASRFKPAGPRGSLALLNNFNIDAVLQEWAAAHDAFYNFPFAMMDFGRTGAQLARVDPPEILEGRATQNLGKLRGSARRPCASFACVLNTDTSSGRGKHWVAVFGDCRSRATWSVEYFNSAGNPPPAPVTRWLEDTAASLRNFRIDQEERFGDGGVETVALTDVRHQDSATECGLYALYFIRRRLEGAPYSEFRGRRIPDEAMTEFRAHVFRGD